ncbi:VOC family protein [bacterium]|nr:VOC family protein [bacterium]
MKGKLHHVEIYVDDLNESKNFWAWFLGWLGYDEFQTWESGFSFIFDGTYLVFVQTEKEFLEPKFHRKRTGLNHLAFFVNTQKEVDELKTLLEQKEVKILYQNQRFFGENYYALFFEDPNRIKVEVVAKE